MQMQFSIGLHTAVCFRLYEDTTLASHALDGSDMGNQTSLLHTIRLEKLEHHHPVSTSQMFFIWLSYSRSLKDTPSESRKSTPAVSASATSPLPLALPNPISSHLVPSPIRMMTQLRAIVPSSLIRLLLDAVKTTVRSSVAMSDSSHTSESWTPFFFHTSLFQEHDFPRCQARTAHNICYICLCCIRFCQRVLGREGQNHNSLSARRRHSGQTSRHETPNLLSSDCRRTGFSSAGNRNVLHEN